MNGLLLEGNEFVDEYAEEEQPGKVKPEQIAQVVLNATDWTTETILSQLNRENIDLAPRFQRRDAWTRGKKSKFIESLLLGLPIPQLVLAERKGERGRYLVLDGKQRLTSLLKFTGAGPKDERDNNFRLISLEVRVDLNGRQYSDFQTDPLLQNDLDAFNNQTIRTVVIRNWPNAAFLHLVFLRLNTTSVALSPQELRQALFPGPFVDFADERSASSPPLKVILGLNHPDFRMRDVELLVRFMGFANFLAEYSGDLSAFLDMTCERLNIQFHTREDHIKNQADSIDDAINAAIDIFGTRSVSRKWLGDSYEPRINRAILDVLVYYFSHVSIRQAAIENKDAVVASFKDLFNVNTDFRDAVESTTKSLQATYARLSLWGMALRECLQVQIPVPEWDELNNRIIP